MSLSIAEREHVFKAKLESGAVVKFKAQCKTKKDADNVRSIRRDAVYLGEGFHYSTDDYIHIWPHDKMYFFTWQNKMINIKELIKNTGIELEEIEDRLAKLEEQISKKRSQRLITLWPVSGQHH